MKVSRELIKLFQELPDSERKKFEYMLNFYTKEHIFYNFEKLREEAKLFDIYSCAKFNQELEEPLKQLVDNLDLITLIQNFQKSKTFEFETERKSVSDLLLYLRLYTDEDEKSIYNTILKLKKYGKVVKERKISKEQILKVIKNY